MVSAISCYLNASVFGSAQSCSPSAAAAWISSAAMSIVVAARSGGTLGFRGGLRNCRGIALSGNRTEKSALGDEGGHDLNFLTLLAILTRPLLRGQSLQNLIPH